MIQPACLTALGEGFIEPFSTLTESRVPRTARVEWGGVEGPARSGRQTRQPAVGGASGQTMGWGGEGGEGGKAKEQEGFKNKTLWFSIMADIPYYDTSFRYIALVTDLKLDFFTSFFYKNS